MLSWRWVGLKVTMPRKPQTRAFQPKSRYKEKKKKELQAKAATGASTPIAPVPVTSASPSTPSTAPCSVCALSVQILHWGLFILLESDLLYIFVGGVPKSCGSHYGGRVLWSWFCANQGSYCCRCDTSYIFNSTRCMHTVSLQLLLLLLLLLLLPLLNCTVKSVYVVLFFAGCLLWS